MGGEGKPEVSREWLRWVREMDMEMERKEQLVKEWVVCSTCCGFVWRKKRRAMMPNPHPGEVEMLTDANNMRAAVMLIPKLPLVDEEVMEPDAATKNQLGIVLMMRRRMMEQKRCPTCHRSVSDTPETKPCEEDKMVAVGDETMAADDAGSNKKKNKRSKKEGKNKKNKRSKKEGKNKNKRSMEEPKMVASEGEAMVADLGSREDTEYSMGRTGKSSSESNDYSMGRTWKSSSESNEYSMGLTGKCSSEGSDYSMGRTRKPRTKMVTCRLSKEFVQDYIRTHSCVRPLAHSTSSHIIQSLFAHHIAEYEVKCEVHADWQSQCDIKGYVEYQEEVTDDEDNVVE